MLSSKINKNNITKIVNRGTGAGGANTNKNGLKFEEKTSMEQTLKDKGYITIFMDDKKKKGIKYS